MFLIIFILYILLSIIIVIIIMLVVIRPCTEDDVFASDHLTVQGVEDGLVVEVAVVQDEVLDTILELSVLLLLQPLLQVLELHRGL